MASHEAADQVQIQAASGRDERRRTWRSDPALQNRFRVAMLRLVLVALVPTMMLSLFVSQSVKNPEIFLDSPWVLLALGALCAATAALIVRQCDKVSSRYCGPMVRIIKVLESIRRGEQADRLRVRHNDEFTDLVRELNETFVKLGVMRNDDA